MLNDRISYYLKTRTYDGYVIENEGSYTSVKFKFSNTFCPIILILFYYFIPQTYLRNETNITRWMEYKISMINL